MPSLLVSREDTRSRLFRWDEGSVGLGRHESNDVFLTDNVVSRHHAAIFERPDGGWRLRDLGSRDGTWMGDRRVAAHDLEDEQTVRVGPYTLLFRAHAESNDAALVSLAVADPADPVPADVETRVLEPTAPEPDESLVDLVERVRACSTFDAQLDVLVRAIEHRTQPRLVLAGLAGPAATVHVRVQRAEAPATPSRTLLRDALDGTRARVWRDAQDAGGQSIASLGIASAVAVPVLVGGDTTVLFYADWTAAAQPDLEWVAATLLATGDLLRARWQQAHAEREHTNYVRSQRARTQIAGVSRAIRELVRDADRCAAVDRDVLLLGESGTGKELLARRIHENSARRTGPFVVVDANTIPHELFESELFGHVAGAFTGAAGNRTGKVAAAAGGTLFLDEIGDLPESLQGKLLRLLQERTFRRVGEDGDRIADVRFIAATHRDLKGDEVRLDLRMRLMQGVVVRTSPLRERPEDIPFLAYYFLDQLEGRAVAFAPDVMETFLKHTWPGNVRELRALVSNALVFAGDRVEMRDFRYAKETFGLEDRVLPSLAELEREHIIRVLHATHGNQRRAAQILGINPNTLKDKMDRHGLERDAFRTRREK